MSGRAVGISVGAPRPKLSRASRRVLTSDKSLSFAVLPWMVVLSSSGNSGKWTRLFPNHENVAGSPRSDWIDGVGRVRGVNFSQPKRSKAQTFQSRNPSRHRIRISLLFIRSASRKSAFQNFLCDSLLLDHLRSEKVADFLDSRLISGSDGKSLPATAELFGVIESPDRDILVIPLGSSVESFSSSPCKILFSVLRNLFVDQ